MLKIYRASAGSGKTFMLTKDYIRLLFEADRHNRHRKILAVTFTNKATGEMKSRIIGELFRLASGNDSPYREDLAKRFGLNDEQIQIQAKKILTGILHDYSAFAISTIDKYFQQIIRAFARDIGVHGGYELELDTSRILDQSVDNLFSDLSGAENNQLLEWLTQYAEERIEQSENWNMRSNILSLGFEIFKENYQYKAEATSKKLHDREFITAFKKELAQIARLFKTGMMQEAGNALKIIHAHGLETSDFKGSSRSPMNYVTKIADGKIDFPDSLRKITEDINECMTQKMDPGQKQVIEATFSDGLQDSLVKLRDLFDREYIRYNTVEIIRKHLNTLGILSDLALQIKKLTADQNVMLISDTNLLLNKIIDNSDSPFIYEKTGVRTDHFMIDEFQDTSTLQWRNFLPLIKNSLSTGYFNLLVGDVKQSIYRWRNSDWKLLANQIYEDFPHEGIQDEVLNTNWRSDKNIVTFNNLFFENASAILQQKLNENIDPVLGQLPGLSDLTDQISGAYRDMEQQISGKAKDGHVQFNFIDASEAEEGWKDISLNRLPEILENAQSRGYKPGEIAILVRKRDEEQAVIQKLLHYKTSPEAKPGFSYDVMGTEGLMLNSAASVKFLSGMLHLFVNPEDQVQRLIVGFEYAKGKLNLSPDEALHKIFAVKENTEAICPLFSDEENEKIQALKHFSLYEMIEQMIDLFDLTGWHGEVIFIQAFQDVIFKFSTGKNSDLNSFLQWWEKSGDKEHISTPETNSAFRIMTVHKSKGLDFPVVIMPFCDWELDSRMKNILWCETNAEPFNRLPLLPVEYSSGLAKTVFAENYFREMMQTYVDNLNIAYVAFTRPEHELICLSPLPKRDKSGKYQIKTLANLLYHCFENSTAGFLTSGFKPDSGYYKAGEETSIGKMVSSSPKNDASNGDYPVETPGKRLRLRHRLISMNQEDITDNPLDYGIMMHEILCNITFLEDIPAVVETFIRDGKLNRSEAETILKELDEFSRMPEVETWFSKEKKILNETSILTPGGHQYRPDRIVLDGNTAIVIDYKFGEHELGKYEKQVKNYASLLNEMGYSTRSYLCYVKLRKVTPVV